MRKRLLCAVAGISLAVIWVPVAAYLMDYTTLEMRVAEESHELRHAEYEWLVAVGEPTASLGRPLEDQNLSAERNRVLAPNLEALEHVMMPYRSAALGIMLPAILFIVLGLCFPWIWRRFRTVGPVGE